jgi:hypothetical protein
MCADLRGSVRAFAEESHVPHRRRPAERDRLHVVVLDLARAATHATGLDRPLAAPAVPDPHRALHLRGDAIVLRERVGLARLLDQPPPLPGLSEDEVEAGFEDLLRSRAGAGLGEGVRGGRELVEKPLRERDVDPTLLRGEGDHLERRGRGRGRRRAFTVSEFARRIVGAARHLVGWAAQRERTCRSGFASDRRG